MTLLRLVFSALLPFAAGYFMSYLLRAVNAVVAPDLVKDLGLSPGQLGLLTAAYLGAFALFQLPLGVLQLYHSVNSGYFEARSLGYITNPNNVLLELNFFGE